MVPDTVVSGCADVFAGVILPKPRRWKASGAPSERSLLVRGPWAILGRFVGRQLGTVVAQMEFQDERLEKRLIISGSLDTKIAAIRGSARTATPWGSDLYNVIYGRCILRRVVSPNTLILTLESS